MGWTFTIIGLALIVAAYLMHMRAQTRGKKAASWPTTVGTIRSAVVGVISMSSNNDPMSGSSNMLTPVITYAYEVAGQKLECARFRVGVDPRFNTPAKAQALVDKYPVGAPVTVHYDPSNPSLAALDLTIGENYGALMVGAFGGTILFFGLLMPFLGV